MKFYATALLLVAGLTPPAALGQQKAPDVKLRSTGLSASAAQVNRREITGRDNSTARRLRRAPRLAVNRDALLVRRVADNLEKRLKDKCVGYSFQVAYLDGPHVAARAGGAARRAPDPGARAFAADDRMNVASVSKTITAVTLLKLLAEKNIDVNDSIGPHLPKSIPRHSSADAITFRQLLTHRSGIRWGGEPGHDVLLKGLAAGVNPAHKNLQCNNTSAGFCYNNANFGLMRILIPHIESGYVPPADADDYAKSYLYGIRTMQATWKRVFEPLGISGVFSSPPPGADRALSYQFTDPVQAGQDWGDMTATNAYRGWNISAPQMSAVIRALMYTEKLMPGALRDKMLSEQLGIWHDDVGDLDEFGHGGFHPGNPQPNKFNLGEINTVMVGYSNGISVTLIVNSQYGPGLLPLDDAIRPALLEAVKAP